MRATLLPVLLMMCFAEQSFATVRYVPSAEYSTIQAAVDAAADGDQILVGPGSYVGAHIVGKSVAVTSEAGPLVTTISSPSSGGYGFYIRNCINTEIRGFTIAGMSLYGIAIQNTRGVWVHDNVIHSSGSSGIDIPGAYYNSEMLIENNTVVSNIYGILSDGGDGIIRRNVVWGNARSAIGCFFDPTLIQVSCNLVDHGGPCLLPDNTVHPGDPFRELVGFSDLRLKPGMVIPPACGQIGAPLEPNRPPICDGAYASVSEIWPPNHEMVAISILGVTDPDGDPITITVTGITQDEPVDGRGDGHTSPDGAGVGTSEAFVCGERKSGGKGQANGRVYEITFVASDG